MHVARLADWVVIIGVLFFACALYGSCVFLLIRPFIAPKEIVPRIGPIGCLTLLVGLGSIACMLYAWIWEPYHLKVTHLTLRLPELGTLEKPIRVVQFSDTHCDPERRLEEQIPEVIAREKPDIILFSGDSVNSLEGYPNFEKLIHSVMKLAPTFAVKGDWDFAITSRDVLKDSGVKILGYEVLTIRGTQLLIAGADSGASLRDTLKQAPKNLPIIAMFHNPDADVIVDGDAKDISLYCCGHTHGGQIALPFYGALISQSIQGRTYASGLHRLGNTWIYTNRGIGMEGHFPRLRFCAPPEITVFDLIGSSTTATSR